MVSKSVIWHEIDGLFLQDGGVEQKVPSPSKIPTTQKKSSLFILIVCNVSLMYMLYRTYRCFLGSPMGFDPIPLGSQPNMQPSQSGLHLIFEARYGTQIRSLILDKDAIHHRTLVRKLKTGCENRTRTCSWS